MKALSTSIALSAGKRRVVEKTNRGQNSGHISVMQVEAATLMTASMFEVLAPEVGFEPTTLRLTAVFDPQKR